jgi:hypothetical protein
MKIAFYVGTHAKDSFIVRSGWRLTKLAQKGQYSYVTHVEAIHSEQADGSVIIASSSLREGGVRSKQVTLTKDSWIIADVPQWSVIASIDLLSCTKNETYDWRGALATVLPGKQVSNKWFCNEWVAYPYLQSAANFGPHHLAAICMSIGQNITKDYFNSREAHR